MLYRLWKQETVETAILGKVEDVRSLLQDGCSFLPEEESRKSCRERIIQAALEATVLPLAEERDAEKLAEKVGRVARLCSALAARSLAPPPRTPHYVSTETCDELACLGTAFSLWNPEFTTDGTPIEMSNGDDSWDLVQQARHLCERARAA